jgi:prepilin-type N-terminal cleavage/methylation domain-containing protein
MPFRRLMKLTASAPRRRAGFTMIEIMVVIALLGLLASVLAVGTSRLLLDRGESPVDVFWSAVAEARKQALEKEIDIDLRFNNEDQVFEASTLLGIKQIPIPTGTPMQLEFLGVSGGGQTIMIGGRLIETSVLDKVTFFRDGTCTPFRARMSLEGEEPILLEIDPWTCAPILREEEARFP